ncbi:leucine-rich repeat-containing protein 15-like [Schistocerca gregaria]|uniref:leucine-rich repeat-containing protein 15-like n=1 Tax=Schistocerca gregaria TaxID=7010 RepID=UPI00211F0726|nr:leucine-rich repeat-containing protein 15-like [Schistocerca gregaria]XP_049852573.1 leucine-rich repeat-containing protein 15-like [Schistocerca gregaria]
MRLLAAWLLWCAAVVVAPAPAAGRGAWSVCPEACECSLDARGRREVSCLRGGMDGPVPTADMDPPRVEVLRISAPPSHPNTLTIGPIFQHFLRLEELHITRSRVPAIGKHSFWGVPSLRVLNLTENNISHVLDHNFRGLAELQALHLDDNRIESMPSGTFRHLQELRVLTLARNRFAELGPRLFLMLGKLTELDLSGNRLGDLNPEVFKDVQRLRVLRCRGCALSNMNTMVYRLLPDLTLLDLGDNEFKYVAADEFSDLRRLRTLLLDGNQLPVVLENSFQQQHDLEHLSLARNRLAKVTAQAFHGLSTLRSLDLGWNKLDRLEPASFVPLTQSLRELDIAGNALSEENVHYVLQELPNLQNLSIAHLQLQAVPAVVGALAQLRRLNASGNRLTQLPAPLPLPAALLELDVSHNLLRGVHDGAVARLLQLRRLRAHGNPWVCDACHAPALLRLQAPADGPLAEGGAGQCAAPAALRGRRLPDVARLHALPPCATDADYDGGGVPDVTGAGSAGVLLGDESRLGFIAVGGAVLLLLLTGAVLLAGLAYTRHHAAHYYTREERRAAAAAAAGITDADDVFENPAALHSNGDVKCALVAAEKPLASVATISKEAAAAAAAAGMRNGTA